MISMMVKHWFGVKVAKEEVKVLVNVSPCETETLSSSILGKF